MSLESLVTNQNRTVVTAVIERRSYCPCVATITRTTISFRNVTKVYHTYCTARTEIGWHAHHNITVCGDSRNIL